MHQDLARQPRVGAGRPTLGRLGLGLVPCRPFMSYCLWTLLVLDIIKIYKNFGPYGAFPSFDIPEMVDQQNLWNSLVISTYLLYLEWNIGMLAVNICSLWPPTPWPISPRVLTPLESTWWCSVTLLWSVSYGNNLKLLKFSFLKCFHVIHGFTLSMITMS
jgi:hypothetical protein